MKLAEYIEKLKEILEQHGDLDLIYSTDDEGNNYSTVNYKPSLYYATDEMDVYQEDDFEEKEDKTGYNKVVCVN